MSGAGSIVAEVGAQGDEERVRLAGRVAVAGGVLVE